MSETEPAVKRRQRSKKGHRRNTILVRMDQKASQLATKLAVELNLAKLDIINLALVNLADVVAANHAQKQGAKDE